MEPAKAAQLLVSLDKDLAVTIIEGMNSKGRQGSEQHGAEGSGHIE
ncbi:MAG: hypothetical protein R2864_03525 [Syntrophotaleaceae bacterium]